MLAHLNHLCHLRYTYGRAQMSVSEQWRFFWGFLRQPRLVGSVAPSSRFLARAVVGQIPAGAVHVAELGPGTGPITRELLRQLGPESHVLAMEIDPAFCALLRQTLPDDRLHVIEAPAQALPTHATRLGWEISAVVSGLPFANFPPPMREDIVRAAHAALAPGGVFAGYGYAPYALPPVLRRVFGNCHTSFEPRNLPPAFVFTARKS